MANLIELAQTHPGRARKRLNQLRNEARYQGYLDGLLSVIGEGDVIVEIGAGLGEMTKRFSKTGANVVSYEADPLAFEQLKNELKDVNNVELHNVAVDAKEGEVELYRDPKFDENDVKTTNESTIIDRSAYGYENIINVKVKDVVKELDAIIKKYGKINLLYIDANGAELKLMEAMMSAKSFDKVRSAIVFNHQRDFRDLNEQFKTMRTQVESMKEWNILIRKL